MMRRIVRSLVGLAVALPLLGCATRSKVMGCEGAAVSDATVAAPPFVMAPAEPSGPVEATALARQHGLTVTDQGTSVLLAGNGLLARLYPGTDQISLDGNMARMDQPSVREPNGLMVPASGARMVAHAAVEASAKRSRVRSPVVAYVPPPPVYVPSIPLAPPAPVAPPPPVVVAEPVPAGWVPAAGEKRWKWIVLHHSDDQCGCAAKYDQCHRMKGWDCLGYDFVVGNGSMSGDGHVEVGPRWTNQQTGAHAKTEDNRYNEWGVGIVLVGDFEHGGQPTRAQYAAAVRLTRWLMARYGISAGNVLRHGDCKPTACPGRGFPWSKFIADVSAPLASPP